MSLCCCSGRLNSRKSRQKTNQPSNVAAQTNSPASIESPEPQPHSKSSHDSAHALKTTVNPLPTVPSRSLDPEKSPTSGTPGESRSVVASNGDLLGNAKATQPSHYQKTIGALWSEAYDNLKEDKDTAELMDTYERILSNEELQRALVVNKAMDDQHAVNIGKSQSIYSPC